MWKPSWRPSVSHLGVLGKPLRAMLGVWGPTSIYIYIYAYIFIYIHTYIYICIYIYILDVQMGAKATICARSLRFPLKARISEPKLSTFGKIV